MQILKGISVQESLHVLWLKVKPNPWIPFCLFSEDGFYHLKSVICVIYLDILVKMQGQLWMFMLLTNWNHALQHVLHIVKFQLKVKYRKRKCFQTLLGGRDKNIVSFLLHFVFSFFHESCVEFIYLLQNCVTSCLNFRNCFN